MWCFFLILSSTMLFNMFKIVVLNEFFHSFALFEWRAINSLPCGVGFTHCWRLYGNMFLCLYSVDMGCCLIDIYPISLFCVACEAGWHLGITSLSVCPSVRLSHFCYIKITFVVVYQYLWNLNTMFLSI
jgi:hypothetical protein